MLQLSLDTTKGETLISRAASVFYVGDGSYSVTMKAPPTPYSLIWWITDSRNANYHAYGPSFGIGSSAGSSSGVQIYFGYSGENMTTIDVGVDTSSDFHRYGVEIVNNTVSWSFDDKIIYTYQTQRSGQEKYSFAVSIVSTVELPKAVSQIKQFDLQQYDNPPCILNDISGTPISTYSDSPTCTCTQSTVTSDSFQTNAAIESITSANSTTTVSKATAAAAEVTDVSTVPGSAVNKMVLSSTSGPSTSVLSEAASTALASFAQVIGSFNGTSLVHETESAAYAFPGSNDVSYTVFTKNSTPVTSEYMAVTSTVGNISNVYTTYFAIPSNSSSMAPYGEFQTQVYIDELSSISSDYQDSFIVTAVASSSPSTHTGIANRTSSSSTRFHSATIANSASSGIVGTLITSIFATTFILISVL